MRIVKKGPDEAPLNFPGICVFTRDAEGPFLDTGTWLNARQLEGVDPYGYIHVRKVEDMGRAVGMVPKHEYEDKATALKAAEEYISTLELRLESFETLHETAKAIVAR